MVNFLDMLTGNYVPEQLRSLSFGPLIAFNQDAVLEGLQQPTSPDSGAEDAFDPTTGGSTATGSAASAMANLGVTPASESRSTGYSWEDDEEEVRESEPDLTDPYEFWVEQNKPSDFKLRMWNEIASYNNVSKNEMFLPSAWTSTEVEFESGSGQADRKFVGGASTHTEMMGPDGTMGMNLRVEIVGHWASTNPQERGMLNQLLYLSGYQSEPPAAGWMSSSDNSYRTSWARAVEHAAAAGMPVLDYLKMQAQQGMAAGIGGGGGGGGGGGRIRPPVQVISDEDAEELIEETARRTIGRVLTDDEKEVIKAITQDIRSTQTREQNALIDQQMAGGGSAEDPTSVATLAEQGIEDRLETETSAYRTARSFAEFANIIGG